MRHAHEDASAPRSVHRAETAAINSAFRAHDPAPSGAAARAADRAVMIARQRAGDRRGMNSAIPGERGGVDRSARAAPVSSKQRKERLKAFTVTAAPSIGRRTRRGWWRAPPSAHLVSRATKRSQRATPRHTVCSPFASFPALLSPLVGRWMRTVAEGRMESGGDSAEIIFSRPNLLPGPTVWGVIGAVHVASARA